MINDENRNEYGTTINIDIPQQLGNELHWNNSANVLCNYMKEPEYLEKVLENRAIIPRYVIEPVEYLGLNGIKNICFPMTCFCDIPLSKVSRHMSRYGNYGIGLDKECLMKKYKIQPVHYVNCESLLAKDYCDAFHQALETKVDGNLGTLVNYLSSSLMFMKPIWGLEPDCKENKKVYTYQDECEWRYIPANKFPDNINLILKQHETTEAGKRVYSKVLENHKECWLQFEWSEVLYIMVPDDVAVKRIINKIKDLNIVGDEMDLLISKIEVSNRFAENM
jgi:hypothetical protein